MSKPVNLIYGVNERPPALVCFFQGLQQLCMWSAGLVFPVIIARSIGLPWHEVNNLVSLSMIAGGIGTILQALSNRFIGSGYLCPEGPDPSFLAVSLSAAKMGGMPLLFGMTMFGGVFEALLSRLLPRLRILFPTEVTGTVVAMVGISVIPVAMKSLFGISGSDTVSTASEVIVGVVSILLMVAVNLWGKGSLRLYSVLVGIIGGYICALFLGVVTIDSIHQQIGQSAVFKVPFFHRQPLWAFNWSLVLPFAIATVCSTLKNVGDITTCQKINDSGWRRTDMKSVQGGIMADAAASFTGGLIGGLGQASYAANIGLSLAASVTSRVVAFVMGAMIILLGFFPVLAAAFATIPASVMGASLIFAVSFMILSGIQIITSRMIDARKTFVIGISMIFGLSTLMVGDLYAGVPAWLQPVFGNPLSLATVCVIILNLLSRIGLKKVQELELDTEDNYYETMADFFERIGQSWSARREIVDRAVSITSELLESIVSLKDDNSNIRLIVSFDELNLNLNIYYQGQPFKLYREAPSHADILEDEKALLQLSGLLVKKLADHAETDSNNGQCHVHLHFDH